MLLFSEMGMRKQELHAQFKMWVHYGFIVVMKVFVLSSISVSVIPMILFASVTTAEHSGFRARWNVEPILYEEFHVF